MEESTSKEFYYCDYLLFKAPNIYKQKMFRQLKFIELMNPIKLHLKSSHHSFTKEFFNGCNTLKSFIFGGDFLVVIPIFKYGN